MRCALLAFVLGLALPLSGFAQTPDAPVPSLSNVDSFHVDSLAAPTDAPRSLTPRSLAPRSLALRSPFPAPISPTLSMLPDGWSRATVHPTETHSFQSKARYPVLNYVLHGLVQTYCENNARAPQRCPHPLPNVTPVPNYPSGSYPQLVTSFPDDEF